MHLDGFFSVFLHIFRKVRYGGYFSHHDLEDDMVCCNKSHGVIERADDGEDIPPGEDLGVQGVQSGWDQS